LKELLSKLNNKKLVIITVIILITLWLVLPHISINGQHPFTSKATRFCLAIIGLLLAFIKDLVKTISTHKTDSVKLLKAKTVTVLSNIKPVMLKIKHKLTTKNRQTRLWFIHKNDRRQINKNPLYIIMGDDKSGKKSLLNNAEMNLIDQQSQNIQMREIKKQLKNHEVQFSANSTFIIDNNGCTNKSKPNKSLIKYIKKNRKLKPMNGVIITISIGDLLIYTHEERQTMINKLSKKINNLNHTLNCMAPIYIVLTKADSISGFTEFFNDLSQEELSQIWGITFNINNSESPNIILDEFNQEYSELTQRLNKKVLFTLDTEKSLEKRLLIQTFPQQIQLFKKPILTMISELFGSLNKSSRLLRGVYITSSQQSQNAIDFLYSTSIEKYKLTSEWQTQSVIRNEPYFISGIFHSVLQTEGEILGQNLRILKIKKVAKKASIITAPIIALLSCIGLSHAYQRNINLLSKLESNTTKYYIEKRNVNASNISLIQTLPSMNLLNDNLMQSKSTGFFDHFLIAHSKIERACNATLTRAIHAIYIPRLAASLEGQLKSAQNNNAKNLYILLKAYLAFDSINNSDNKTIITAMQNNWQANKNITTTQLAQLTYFTGMVTEQKIDKLPLNNPLINKVKMRLETVNPTQRAYALLTARSTSNQDLPPDTLTQFSGSNNIYSYDDTQKKTINSIYTANGYKYNYLANHNNIVEHVVNDDRIIGLNSDGNKTSEQLEIKLANLYMKNYSKEWSDIINSIKIKQTNSDEGVINQLNALANDNSRLKQTLYVIVENTIALNKEKASNGISFKKLSDYMNNNKQRHNYNELQITAQKLSQYLQNIANSDNPQQSYFKAAVDYIAHKKTNPLYKLAQIENNSPPPLHRWINAIKNNVWRCIEQHAIHYIQQQWNSTIKPDYTKNVSSHYPVDESSSTQMSFNTFNTYFNHEGIILTFCKTYLKPFIDSNKWQLKTSNSNTLNLSTDVITFFKQAHQISYDYFNQNNQSIIKLIITPVSLSSNAKNILIKQGDLDFNYQHGPQIPFTINWPSHTSDANSMIAINTFDDQNNNISSYGDWSLFKVINSKNIKLIQKADHINMLIQINNYTANMQIDTSTKLSDLQLKPLIKLVAPIHFEEENHESS
jgi:type VI secretion system protein ImpL